MSKVLVVDDDVVNRLILKGMLLKSGHDVIEAENGAIAVELFQKESPQLVLMDIMMPVMDGFEATKIIKESSKGRFVPVIVLTAMNDGDELVKCVNSGADDFLTKPFSHVLLMAKIKALKRTQDLYSTVEKQRDEIEKNRQMLLEEQAQAFKIYSRMTDSIELDHIHLRYHMSPMSIFNGDMLLTGRAPDGTTFVMLTDATGHGLPAALAAFPVHDIFHAMVKKGISGKDIINELNRKLVSILPTEFFLCGVMLVIPEDQKTCQIWNGGMPDVLVYRHAENAVVERIKAANLPLGIASSASFSAQFTIIDTLVDDCLLLYSDGATEAQAEDGSYYGEKRFLDAILSSDVYQTLDTVMKSIRLFTGGSRQSDDVSLIEYTVTADHTN
jgi:CheY-like chemotaxis protein